MGCSPEVVERGGHGGRESRERCVEVPGEA